MDKSKSQLEELIKADKEDGFLSKVLTIMSTYYGEDPPSDYIIMGMWAMNKRYEEITSRGGIN
jgi:hypothetical protein|tara:strand:+ start:286 stop:474 length:189 start_codon:yes stop_codon:yes gene_type:complete